MLSPADDAVRAYLRESMIALVATRSAKGHPFLTPLWFVHHGGALYITTGPETWAGRNVAEHPEVTLLFRSDRQPRSDRVLRVRGRAVCHRGLPWWRVLLRAAGKYYVSPRALPVELRNIRRWSLRRLYYGQLKGGFGYIRVLPMTAEFLPAPSPNSGSRSAAASGHP